MRVPTGLPVRVVVVYQKDKEHCQPPFPFIDNAKVVSILHGRMAFQTACSDIIRIVPHCSELFTARHKKSAHPAMNGEIFEDKECKDLIFTFLPKNLHIEVQNTLR